MTRSQRGGMSQTTIDQVKKSFEVIEEVIEDVQKESSCNTYRIYIILTCSNTHLLNLFLASTFFLR